MQPDDIQCAANTPRKDNEINAIKSMNDQLLSGCLNSALIIIIECSSDARRNICDMPHTEPSL